MAVEQCSPLYHVTSIDPAMDSVSGDLSAAWSFPHFLCSPKYRFNIFRSKGAVLVLFWCFLALFVLQFVTLIADQKSLLILEDDNVVNPLVIFNMCMLFYPILGWLADVKFGRYQIVRWGLRTLWVVSILLCLASVTLDFVSLPLVLVKFVKPVLYVPICLSLGCLISNILQFGIDQLEDASSSEIMSFLRWFTWLWCLSGVAVGFSLSCLCPAYETLRYFLFATLVTAATASDLLFNHWLVKETVSNNPLVLIFQVLRYAIKNRYPRERSAFTYWDDKHHSRIDLAKYKFGGPFTTEQVEDVKASFRIIGVIIAGAFLGGLFLSAYPMFSNVMRHLTDKHFAETTSCNTYSANCFQRTLARYSGDVAIVVWLPFFEFVLHPLFYRLFRFSILRKASFGMVFLLLSFIACTAIEFVANQERLQAANATNTTCDLFSRLKDSDRQNSLPLDYKWVALPIILNSIGQFVTITTASEFLCAQSPYSMRGLLFGLAYGSIGFFAILGYGILRSIAAISRKWLSNGYGCRAWYLLMSSLLFLILLGIFFSVFKCYKKRNRDDSEIFAVNQ